jgi:hypothetical protein
MVPAFQIRFVGVRRRRRAAVSFDVRDGFREKRSGHSPGDLRLDLEHVRSRPIVGFGPERAPVRGVDETRRDPKTVALTPEASLERVVVIEGRASNRSAVEGA